MSLSLHSGMTFLSQVRPVGVNDKITGSRQRLPREKSLTKDDSKLLKVPGESYRKQAAREGREIFIWFKGQYIMHI